MTKKSKQHNFKRACRVSVKFATAHKRKMLSHLLLEQRRAVNFYITELWCKDGEWNQETKQRLKNTRLSSHLKSSALNQALGIVAATRASAKALKVAPKKPLFTGAVIFSQDVCVVEPGKKSFDLAVKLSYLRHGRRLVIPTRHTKVTRKWLGRPLAELVQGCALSEHGIILWVKCPTLEHKTVGQSLGVDLGMNKLLSTSEHKFYGQGFKALSAKIRRKKKGSKAIKRAYVERDDYINQTINQLPWASTKMLAVEGLKDMKLGKRKNRGKNFRKALAPWTYSQVLARLQHKSQENRVFLVSVDPRHTSQMCPVCDHTERGNRKAEDFECLNCGANDDADYTGAVNILNKALLSDQASRIPEVPKCPS